MSGAAIARLVDIISASWMCQAAYAAAELGIPDLLDGASRSVDDLARTTRCDRASLFRLLRALAALDICIENADGSFAVTEMGRLLATRSECSLRSWALWAGNYQWQVWGRLLASVQSGRTARQLAGGDRGFVHLEADATAAAVFHETMAQLTRLVSLQVARDYDFAPAQHVVDVGGGHGELLANILSAHEHLHGTLYDRPHALKGAEAQFRRSKVAQRCTLLAGDFFQAVPPAADIYILKSILHDWDDHASVRILDVCRRAMSDRSRLLLVERVMPERMEPSQSHRLLAREDLNMLVGPGGRERTAVQWAGLVETARFKLLRLIPSAMNYSIIECAPA